jgi:hypothetical protein
VGHHPAGNVEVIAMRSSSSILDVNIANTTKAEKVTQRNASDEICGHHYDLLRGKWNSLLSKKWFPVLNSTRDSTKRNNRSHSKRAIRIGSSGANDFFGIYVIKNHDCFLTHAETALV